MATHTPLGSSDSILSMGILETSSTGGGSTDVQHHSGRSLKTEASEHHHIFHCCTSTGGSLLNAALLKSSAQTAKSLPSSVSERALACSPCSDHRMYFNTLLLTQRRFINPLASLGIPVMFKILSK